MEKSIKISIRIIALFSIAIVLSFIPEYLHDLFGDWYCSGSGIFVKIDDYRSHYTTCDYANNGYHLPMWHWGYRHWLWLMMGISLAIVQIVGIVNLINSTKQNK